MMYPLDNARTAKSRIWLALLCSTVMASSAIVTQVTPAFSLDAAPIANVSKPAPNPSVLKAIQQDLARLGVESVKLVSFSEQNWPDGCLGLPRGKEACTMAIVPGWRVEVSDGLQTWFYRSDKTGSVLRLEDADRAMLPQKVAAKLIQRVARDTRVPAAKLKIAAVKPANFDGCLGIYRPNQACTKILIRGWQAIVTTPNQSLIYHLDQEASRIAFNDTASGARRKVRVSFELFGGGEVPPLTANVIFQSSSSGDLLGRTTTITLTEDGKVTSFTIAPNIRSRPVVIKTLTPKQVESFKQTLQTRRFRNFNGLSYLTSAALADYPTTTYQSQDTVMQLIDLEKASFPRSLQQVVKVWETLIQP
jgi:hypothetical protein